MWKQMRHSGRLAALLLAAAMLLAACGGQAPDNGAEEPEIFSITAAVSAESRADVEAHHLYENLMAWADDGRGFARLVPGQAEHYTVETDYTGCATYTFTLRRGLTWSDGQAVTAGDFADAWRRLADPAAGREDAALLEIVAGYDQVRETGDTSLLAVSAPDERTFVVTLSGTSAYFLEELCAGSATMPVRRDLLTAAGEMDGTVTNGPYRLSRAGGELLVRSQSYRAAAGVGPEQIYLETAGDSQGDYQRFLAGELDLVTELPQSALQTLAESGFWVSEPVSATYGIVLNTRQAPFDSLAVRQAFRLAVDEAAVVAALGDLTRRPAVGLVPYGVGDYSQRPETEETPAEEPVLPDPNAPAEPETPDTLWDFRAHSQELVTAPAESDYAADCLQAQALMAQAGYAGGGGFPVVEYLYVDSQEGRLAAQTLQDMWQQQLGVTVTLRSATEEEYAAALSSGQEGEGGGAPAFTMAAQWFTASCSDAESFLSQWHSASSDNFSGYASDAFDILLGSAAAALSPDVRDARDAYLHDAEAILLSDSAVVPLYYQGSSFLLAEGLTGLYRGPDGLCFLSQVTPDAGDAG